MRIAVWHNLPSGGGKRALHDHVKGLVARGHHVESWSTQKAELGYLPLSPYAVEHVVPVESASGGKGRLKRWTAPYEILGVMERHAQRCVEEIEAAGFDVLFANACYDLAVPYLGRFTKLPSVLYLGEPARPLYETFWSPHPNQPMWAASPVDGGSRLRRVRKSVADVIHGQAHRVRAREEARSANAFDRVLCNSRFSREAMLKVYGRECDVCYLGIDLDAFPLSTAPKEPYVIGLGSFGALKGVDLAVRAIAAIERPRRPRLVWVGNTVNSPEFFRKLVDLSAELGVEFVPKHLVSQEELADLLGRAATMIYPSRLEPFGYAPLEANACGTTVVGIAEGGIRESIQPGVNGLLADGPGAGQLAPLISRYVDDLELARAEGIKARQHVAEHWDVQASVDRLESFLLATHKAGHRAGAGAGAP